MFGGLFVSLNASGFVGVAVKTGVTFLCPLFLEQGFFKKDDMQFRKLAMCCTQTYPNVYTAWIGVTTIRRFVRKYASLSILVGGRWHATIHHIMSESRL
jgi:hypothetical protein